MSPPQRATGSPPSPSTISRPLRAGCTCRPRNSAGPRRRPRPPLTLEETTMSTAKQVPVDASASPPNALERARQLASALLSERGEASGAMLSRELHDVVRKLGADDRHGFQRFLAAGFQPDATALRAAAEKYLAGATAEAAADLAQAADPPRQELLRRMNMAGGGTAALVAMRKEILARLRDEPAL